MSSITFKHGSADFYGGIWQISETDFESDQKSLSKTVVKQINAEFHIDWTKVSYKDLVKPLYSGLAARIRIAAYYGSNEIPQDEDAQADYWARQYTINTWGNNTVTINLFISRTSSLTTSCESPKADIVFVLDGSGSIGSTNFDNVKTFVNAVVRSFDIGAQKVRVGLIEFSNTAAVQFNLTKYYTTAGIMSAVNSTAYQGGSTNSAAGIKSMQTMFEQEGRQNEGVPLIGIFMTDGHSNDAKATKDAAQQLHVHMPDVTVFSVGVGSNVDVNELDVIASDPDCLHVYELSSFSDIVAFTDQIMEQSCRVPASISSGTEISGTIKYQQYYYFKITVHKQKKGVKIQIKTPQGGVKTYFSWKVNNPSSALYDYTAEVASADGIYVHIPWDDEVSYNNDDDQANENDSSSDKDSASLKATAVDATGTIYGAMVGSTKGDNVFTMSYTDGASLIGADQKLVALLVTAVAALVRRFF
jgi:Mg-chelatase subunit ChlD